MLKLMKVCCGVLLILAVLNSIDARHSIKTTVAPKVKTHHLTVHKVADGDTITVKNHTSNKYVRVRFLCIDAPEKSQKKWGPLSLNRLKELLPLKSSVTLVGSEVDMYNRTLAEVVNSNGTNTNLKMMEEGMVVFYPYQKGCKDYRAMEAKAKKEKKGVWKDKSFEKPWDYRKRAGIGYRGGKFNKSNNGTTYSENKYKYKHVTTTKITQKVPSVWNSTTRRYSERLENKTSTVFSYRDMLLKSKPE